ncbi:hypothetical protein IHC93_19930 [Photobacterium damselae subsp. damselae]|uniref:hypothetical protein n=1 Tax=Photobacterium damselae TaxID=38293 RepID=UPI001F365888|nr:hypothetical protein [Photobacterium damselae]UKA27195.1 hypothetical protein IHC93_19930 [Photobacterium damselae subsp. damselae]
MKRLFFATAVLMSFSSMANMNSESWDIDSMAVVNFDGEPSMLSIVSYASRSSIALGMKSSSCITRDNNATPYGVIKVNTVGVKFVKQCVGNGVEALMPYTNKGNNYIIKELKNKKIVQFKDLSFSTSFKTKGFTPVYDKYKNYSDDKGI